MQFRSHSGKMDFSLEYYLRRTTRKIRGMESLFMTGDLKTLVSMVL